MSSDQTRKQKKSKSSFLSSNILDQSAHEIKVSNLNTTKDGYTLVYFGAGWDFKPVNNPLFSKFNHFIFIDSLPKLNHYNEGTPGYEKSKDIKVFLETLSNSALNYNLKLISVRRNLLTFKNDKIKLEYYFNTTVQEALTNTIIRRKINKAVWVHNKGFNPYEYGLKPGDLPNLLEDRSKLKLL